MTESEHVKKLIEMLELSNLNQIENVCPHQPDGDGIPEPTTCQLCKDFVNVENWCPCVELKPRMAILTTLIQLNMKDYVTKRKFNNYIRKFKLKNLLDVITKEN